MAFIAALALAPGARGQLGPVDGPEVRGFIFGDAVFEVEDQGEPDGFSLGQIVGHANATLSERVVFFGELSISARSSGYALSMERAILRYEFDDPLKVSVGRYHTPISYWNVAFHHGLWLQGSVARPEAVRFGSRFVPVHFVGAMAEGNLSEVPLHYSVGVGNGRAENIAGAGDAGDVNSDRAVIVSASLRPRGLVGFRAGGAMYLDRISDGAGPVADERITSGHVAWDRGAIEAIAEVIHVAHDPVGASTSSGSHAYYLHFGHRLPVEGRAWTPYVRYERTEIESDDVIFGGGVVDDYEAWIAGVRFDFGDFAALKAEYRGEQIAAQDRQDSYYLQASYAIPVGGR